MRIIKSIINWVFTIVILGESVNIFYAISFAKKIPDSTNIYPILFRGGGTVYVNLFQYNFDLFFWKIFFPIGIFLTLVYTLISFLKKNTKI